MSAATICPYEPLELITKIEVAERLEVKTIDMKIFFSSCYFLKEKMLLNENENMNLKKN